jgi:RecB family endonuclease NucS
MVKADGCVAVHADGGAYKPLNWMNAPNTLIDEGDVWIVQNPKGETLTIEFTAIHFETAIAMGEDPGLQKDGVELELQRLLAEQPQTFGEGMALIRREYPTPIGPVDLLCRDADGTTVAIEVKRRGEIDGVEQLTRYLEFLNRDTRLAPVRGIFAAQVIKPQARLLAEDRGIGWIEVDYDELRGVESDLMKLF